MKEYVQVNNVRFLSMIGIVAIHSYLLDPGREAPFDDYVKLLGAQFFKFGTICFFMISGYLIGDRMSLYEPQEFFKRRLRAVGLPWLFWASAFFVLLLISTIGDSNVSLATLAETVIFRSEYWFVPNFMLALGVLVLLSKYNHSLATGIALLAVSLCYSANIYLQFIPSEHTMSLFGYVFYLWLGMQIALKVHKFSQTLVNLSTQALMVYGFVAYVASILESAFVAKYGSSEVLNTLRVSNQFYSVVIFLLMFKITRSVYPRFVNPIADTFGIYLIQWIIISIYNVAAIRIMGRLLGISSGDFREQYLQILPWHARIAWWAFSFALVYLTSLVITKAIARTRFYWLVGKEPSRIPVTTKAL